MFSAILKPKKAFFLEKILGYVFWPMEGEGQKYCIRLDDMHDPKSIIFLSLARTRTSIIYNKLNYNKY